jgi:hypothetical protein
VTGITLDPGVNILPDELADRLLGSGLVQPLPEDLELGSDPDWPPQAAEDEED